MPARISMQDREGGPSAGAGAPRATRELDHIAGDDGLPVFGHTFAFLRDARASLMGMHRRYGPVFRYNSFFERSVVLLGPAFNEAVLFDRERLFSSRLGWDHHLGALFPRGLLLRDGDDHRRHRRLMQAAFKPAAMRRYVELMTPLVAERMQAWSGRRPLRFYPEAKQLLLDAAAVAFLGLSLGPEADRVNRAFIDLVTAAIAVVRAPVPGLGYHRGLRARAYLTGLLRDLIPARRDGGGDDMLSQLCRATDEGGARLHDDEIVDHMVFLLMAAHDTTASALATLALALADHPDWQDRLAAEGAALGAPAPDLDALDRLTDADLAFNEALRLYTPVRTLPRRTLRACAVAGVKLPANTQVWISPDFTHLMPEWWSEPERFDPERFAEPRAEHRGHPFLWLPFGGGVHKCLGMHFARLQVRMVVHRLLPHVRLRLSRGRRPAYRFLPFPHPRRGLPLVLEPR